MCDWQTFDLYKAVVIELFLKKF